MSALFSEGGGGHSDPFSFLLLALAALVAAAMLGRWLARRVGQPPVLGELITGIVLGNVGYLLGLPLFVLVMHFGDVRPVLQRVWLEDESVGEAASQVFSASMMEPGGLGRQLVDLLTGSDGPRQVLLGFGLWLFSNLGVILLLFAVGLETSVAEMLKVGKRAVFVAVLGVVVPFGLGYGASVLLLPELEASSHLFLAATLCATSVGITARVFKDLGALDSGEAKLILGSAVLDDVLGLVLLAVVVGLVESGQLELGEVARIVLSSAAFLGVILIFGERFTGWIGRLVQRFDLPKAKLLVPLVLAFATAWFANQIALASIVGAFAAGLVVRERHFENHQQGASIQQLVAPLETIFAPMFFVLMGMQVNLESFVQAETLVVAAILTAVAVVSKLVAGWPAGEDVDRLVVGVGMMPRGEVGLIFASIGRGLGVVDDALFSALVLMVIVTTLVTPPALRWRLA